jgi:hypothetical protein
MSLLLLNGAKEIIERDRPIIVLEIDSRAVTYNDFMLSLGLCSS